MGRLLPTTSDATVERTDDPELLCIDDERSEAVLAALASDTGREVFRALNDEPLVAKDLAAELDTSVQAVSYHLENLEDAGLVEVLDTCYSEKGQEMKVYGPPAEPLVLFLGSSDDRPGLLAAFKRFAGAIGPVAIALSIGQTVTRWLGVGEG